MLNKTNHFLYSLFILWLGHFLVDFMIGIWSVYKTIAHIDIALAGLVAGIGAFAGEGMQVVFGNLSDKGYKKILVIIGLFATIASAFFPYVDHLGLLFGLFLLTCMGSGAFHPSAASSVGALSQDRKGLAMSIFASGGALGLALSQMLFAQSFHFFDGHTFFLAIPSFVLCAFLLLYPLPNKEVIKKGNPLNWSFFKMFFKNKELTLLYFTQVFNQSMMWGMVFLLPDILVSRGYESWIAFGGGHFFFIVGGAFMMIPAGYFADKYSSKLVMTIGPSLGMIAFYFFITNPLLSPALLFILLFLIGASFGVVNPVLVAYGHKLLPGNPGVVSAMLMGLAWCLSECIGPGGGGLLTHLFEDDAAAKALTCLSLLLIASIITTRFLPEEEKEVEVLVN